MAFKTAAGLPAVGQDPGREVLASLGGKTDSSRLFVQRDKGTRKKEAKGPTGIQRRPLPSLGHGAMLSTQHAPCQPAL